MMVTSGSDGSGEPSAQKEFVTITTAPSIVCIYYAIVFQLSLDIETVRSDTVISRCEVRDLVTPKDERRMCCQVGSLLQEDGAG